MKNIAVLLYDLVAEYHITVVDGILSFFKEKKDVSLFIAPVNVPHATTNECDYQYWTSTDILANKQVDGIIVLVNSFTSAIAVDRLTVELEKFLPKPIISISVPLNLSTNKYTYISSKKAYCQIVEHLIEKHNRKKIAFFSAELDGSPESDERLESYKLALKENGLEFDPKLVFPGDFTPGLTHGYIKEHYKSKKDLDFDALLCANDYMALGAMGALQEIGVKIPDDVCIFGFDDSEISVNCSPTASTVNQHLVESGRKAAELVYKSVYGKETPQNVQVDCQPVFRESCGCNQFEPKMSLFFDQTGTYFDHPNAHGNVLNLFGNALNDMGTIYHMLNMTDSVIDIDDYFISLIKNLKKIHIPSMYVCLYNKEIPLKPDDDFKLPDKASILIHYDENRMIEKNYYNQKKIKFNPRKELIPKELGDFNDGYFFILPLSLKNLNYGYVIAQLPMNKYVVYEVFLKILCNSLIHSYEYSKRSKQEAVLVEKNQTLNIQSKTDELTNLFNRRGFITCSQRLLDLSLVTETKGCVFFFDLDGLKIINDTWGHKTGDFALQTTAAVLKKAFHKSDLVGRLSGDEFAVFSPGFSKVNEEILRKRIKELNEEFSIKNKLPFTLSISMGVVEYDSSTPDLQQLLLAADKLLYKEKKIKHAIKDKEQKK